VGFESYKGAIYNRDGKKIESLAKARKAFSTSTAEWFIDDGYFDRHDKNGLDLSGPFPDISHFSASAKQIISINKNYIRYFDLEQKKLLKRIDLGDILKNEKNAGIIAPMKLKDLENSSNLYKLYTFQDSEKWTLDDNYYSKNGNYLRIKSDGWRFVFRNDNNIFGIEGNFRIEAKIRILEGNGTYFGLFNGAERGDQARRVLVTNNGEFWGKIYSESKQNISKFNKGNDWNILAIERKKDELAYYVNGVKIQNYQYSFSAEPRWGFVIEGNGVMEVEYALISVIRDEEYYAEWRKGVVASPLDVQLADKGAAKPQSSSKESSKTSTSNIQTTSGLSETSPWYNGPVDSLLVSGDKALQAGVTLRTKTPGLALLFYNRAAELNPNDPLIYTRIGTAYLYYQMYQQALENFAKSLALDPSYPLAHYGIFKVAKDQAFATDEIPQQKLNALLRQCESFISLAPNDYGFEKMEANFVIAYLTLYQKDRTVYNKYKTALANGHDMQTLTMDFALSDAAKIGGKEMVNHLARYAAFYAKQNKNFSAASSVYKTMIREGNPDALDYWEASVNEYAAFEEKDDAFKMVNEGLKKFPGNAHLLSALNTMNLNYGMDLYNKGDKPLAYQYLTKYKPEKSGNPLNYYQALGVVCYTLENYTCAAKNLSEFTTNSPDEKWKKYYPNLTQALNYAKKPVGVAPVIIDYYDSIQHSENIYMEGSKLVDEGKYEDGLKKMLKAAAFFERFDDNEGKAICYSGIGRAYMYLKNREKSFEYLHKCIEAGPVSGGAYSNLGSCYMADGDYKNAEKYMMEGYKLFPDFPDLATNLMSLWFDQGSIKYKAEKYSEAITMYKKALEFREHAQVYLFLGFAYYMDYNTTEAKKYLRKAVEMEPSYLDADVKSILNSK
jgi:tetratricopeptide (TPR) repeat protein